MKITLAAIGRLKAGGAKTLYDDYVQRLGWPLVLKEIDLPLQKAGPALQRQEGDKLLAAIPDKAKCVVLDERGQNLDSLAFAKLIGGWQDQGVSDIAFLIGGADGHSDAVRARADKLISFGVMTWPHMLARVMLAEQIYRAQQILAGHPYHRGN
jgi:23S rRNA (pseudouridine1915-N3)-methyltransferase